MKNPDGPKKSDKEKIIEAIKKSTQTPPFKSLMDKITNLESSLSPEDKRRYNELHDELDRLMNEDKEDPAEAIKRVVEGKSTPEEKEASKKFVERHRFLVQAMWDLLARKKDNSKPN